MAKEVPAKNLDKALELLQFLSRQDEPQNVAQLSRYLGVTRNTVYAMLSSLQNFHFVEKSADGGFAAGYGLLELVSNYYHQYPFLYVAERHVQELSRRLERPISILVYKSPLNCLRLYTTGGSLGSALVHACTTAPGKLLLAAQPEDVIQSDLNERPVEAYTEKTITDPAVILSQIPAYRDADWAEEWGERFPDCGTIAVKICNRTEKTVAALSIFFDARPEEAQLHSILSQLRLCGMRISQELGSARAALI
ncbi:MAG: helix-turn-helix domain-containing protein [Oscillospiraceae bacterium]|nr:helix-turn-helix domain-containing protein [Oscillospiraceae bacterium]